MADEYERTNARQWDESLQNNSSTPATHGGRSQVLAQPPPSVSQPRSREARPSQQSREPVPPQRPQPRDAHGVRIREHQRGSRLPPHHPSNVGRWQGEVPQAPRRRAALVGDFGTGMAKLLSGTPKLKDMEDKRWQNDVKRQQLRNFPPANFAFESIGTFHWPVDEYHPDEELGANSEALDPIRLSENCFIKWMPDDSTFKVLGTTRGVQKALIKLRQTCFQIAARNIAPDRKYISHWRTAPPGLYVHLDVEYENPQVLVPAGEPTGSSRTPRAEGELTEKVELAAAKTLEACGIEAIKVSHAKMLQKIHYLRGQIQFRIRLGTFVPTSHKSLDDGEVWGLSDYEEMTSMTQFRGRVTEELGGRETESRVLARLRMADELLLPFDHMQEKLSEVKPTYSAEFVFKHEAGNLQLSMSWTRNKDRAGNGFHFLKSKEKWARLDRDTGKATDLIDMNLVDLHNGSAWHFDMKTSQAVEPIRVPAELREFSTMVSISFKQASDDHPSVTWAHKGSPIYVRTSTDYRFNIKRTDYTLELSNFQIREKIAGSAAVKTYERRCGLNVYRTEWDNDFAKNERIKISDKAEWGDGFELWFPEDASYGDPVGDKFGFDQLMQKLANIEELVRA